MALRAFVDAEGRTQGPAEYDPAAERVRATDRITIRLHPGDGAVIARRAAERGMKTATYLAAMTRTHIAPDPPLFTNAALKHSIAALCELGTILAHSARNPALSGPGLEGRRPDAQPHARRRDGPGTTYTRLRQSGTHGLGEPL